MGILDTAKDVIELVQKADNIDLYRQVLDLQRQILELVDDNRRLRDENAELRRSRDIGDNLVFEENWYYLQRGDTRMGPFCSLCWDRDNKLVRAARTGDSYWCQMRH